MNNYDLQKTTLWSFPERGNWATHRNCYRGNWSPHVPRNLILNYTRKDDTVLDMFVGSGTTLIETKILGRNGIGIDINPKAIEISKTNLLFECKSANQQILLNENSERSSIENNSIDFICTHPPYANIINYSDNIDGDLSLMRYEDFLIHWDIIAKECRRVLKPGKICSYMIGDCRKNGKFYPLGFESMNIFINNGFVLKEIIIKEQHNCRSFDYWAQRNNNFYLLAHEYIFCFINSK